MPVSPRVAAVEPSWSEPVDSQLDRVYAFFEVFGGAPFGPPVDAAPDATRLARVIARTGRDPHWSPAR